MISRCCTADLAVRLGFGDPSYFNRAFRRAHGEIPSGVRQRSLQ
ncbi:MULTISPECIES: helix-turn-helix domain-containing protein [unclassified Nitrobacter]|nr:MULTISPECIES: helix-turn-helix domain-containing protein [unclassified Nitrobacter]MBN9146633.1 helix-turn-helix domain-containing protein [Nitrobacter sp.]